MKSAQISQSLWRAVIFAEVASIFRLTNSNGHFIFPPPFPITSSRRPPRAGTAFPAGCRHDAAPVSTSIIVCHVSGRTDALVPGLNPTFHQDFLHRIWSLLFAIWICGVPVVACAQTGPGESRSEPLTVSADFSRTWQEGDATVHLLHGHCVIEQGDTVYESGRAVIWRRTDERQGALRERVTVYLEDNVRVQRPGSSTEENKLLTNFTAEAGVLLHAKRPVNESPAPHDPTFQRALKERGAILKAPVRPTRLRQGPDLLLPPEPLPSADVPPDPDEPIPEFVSRQLTAPAGPVRRFSIFSRTGGNWNFESFPSPDSTPPEQLLVFKGGVNLVVEGIDRQVGDQPIGTIDLSADQILIWTDLESSRNFSGSAEQSTEMPLQVYLEGNIVIRQGNSVLRASQAYYDVRENRALLLNSELKTRIEGFPAAVRVRAQQLRQLSLDTYQANNAYITTSEFEKPGYRLQASEIFVEPRNMGWYGENPTVFNPATGQYETDQTLWATATDTTLFVEDVPLFYLPQLSAPAEDPNIPLRNVNLQYDRIFGFQVQTTWDAFKLFGLDRPEGQRWDLQADYLTFRGPRAGLDGTYSGGDRFGVDGNYRGNSWSTLIYDMGHDNLGQDRLNLIPKQETRGGASLRDRWDLPYDMTLYSEFAFLSDRNYLEQYRERDYDIGKDYETLLQLKQAQENWAWTATIRPQFYNYYNNTQWLPRGDLYILGEPLFNTPITWSSHSYASYAMQRIADRPTDPNDYYSVLPYEGNANVGIFATRNELDLPFDLGPFHVVPYVLGEAAAWAGAGDGVPVDVANQQFIDSQGQTGHSQDAANRLYGAFGVRSSIEFWKAWPEVTSDLFALNGLAHKMTFDVDWSYAQSTADLNQILQYNEIDDNSQEQFRRRLFRNTFNYNVPAQFEPRYFAVRSGAGTAVTAPFNELVDDMNAVRLGWRNRWQTKSGPLNAPRIRNWMTLDLETTIFPNSERDNFGQLFGLYGLRYNWYISDRTTITAGALTDSFDNPERLFNVGVMSQRSTRGSVYLGYRKIEGGPLLDSQIVTASYSYVMSPKWISSLSAAYDVGEGQSRGESLTLTRVGADFLMHFGLSVDPTKNNYGVGFSIEPRFAPFVGNYGAGGSGTQLGSLLQPYGR